MRFRNVIDVILISPKIKIRWGLPVKNKSGSLNVQNQFEVIAQGQD